MTVTPAGDAGMGRRRHTQASGATQKPAAKAAGYVTKPPTAALLSPIGLCSLAGGFTRRRCGGGTAARARAAHRPAAKAAGYVTKPPMAALSSPIGLGRASAPL